MNRGTLESRKPLLVGGLTRAMERTGIEPVTSGLQSRANGSGSSWVKAREAA